MRHLSILVVAACGASATSLKQDLPQPPLAQKLDKIVTDALAEQPSAGLSLAVYRDGKAILVKGFGKADLENDVAADARTVYRIGSITKQFTAVAIMQLVEHGRLSLDDDVSKYVDFPAIFKGKKVTVRQLLTHTSGIMSYTEVRELLTMVRALSHAELLAYVKDAPFDFEPGTSWKYDNTGYYLLGMIVEKVSGSAYADYLAANVFGRAGLADTSYCLDQPLIPRRARGYGIDASGKLVNADPIHMSIPFAAG
jgi:CubicO group peptidase (beta-lactamase class C family)